MLGRRSKKQGLSIGELIPGKELLDLSNKTQLYAFFFVSLQCFRCLEFLPCISDLKAEHRNIMFVLISNGSVQENEELLNYYSWDFQIIHMNDEKMLHVYKVEKPPFVLVVNYRGQVIAKGEISKKVDFKNILDQ